MLKLELERMNFNSVETGVPVCSAQRLETSKS